MDQTSQLNHDQVHPDLDQLNREFSLKKSDNQLSIQPGKDGVPFIELFNRYASALISLQGAHILSWIPKGEEDVIWLSEEARLEPGKSIRGGVPICWPWFGAYEPGHAGFDASPRESNFPAHGFARTSNWQILSTEALQNGNTRIIFTMKPQPNNTDMWPQQTSVQYIVTIGKKLELELITHNDGAQPVTIGQALHTYFRVGDISKTILHGLDNAEYLDKPDNFNRKTQLGPIDIEGEVDRIYLDTSNDCIINDMMLKRNIVIVKCGSHSTVVWNPGEKVAEQMGNLGKDGYRQMLCVESANAADDIVTIEPGKAHQLWVQYEVHHPVHHPVR